MSSRDPFDRVRQANPVDPKELPGAPLGMAQRIVTSHATRRFRLAGPALAAVSMAAVLLVGGLTTLVMMVGGSRQAVTEESSTTAQTATTTETAETTPMTTAGPTHMPAAPWASAPLPQNLIPQHLVEDWNRAENRTWCSALFPVDAGTLDGETRSADFGGGWAVAWDLPGGPGRSADDGYCPDCGRSAFGIAGAGGTGTSADTEIWPERIGWDDGSVAGYGLEGLDAPPPGEPAPPLLSYLVVEGQGCLYNVWSFLGEDHLLSLIGSLRFVEGLQAERIELLDRSSLQTRQMGPAPWEKPPLGAARVPAVFFAEWDEDLGTTVCPMMAFEELGPEGREAAARRANGDGALLVAWDLPAGPGRYPSGDYCADCGRGAFGTSLERHPGVVDYRVSGVPPTIRFGDGSQAWIFAEYNPDLPAERIVHLDPETGTPAPEAYRAIVEVSGHPECLYQIWSSYGPDHVENLLTQLRFVER